MVYVKNSTYLFVNCADILKSCRIELDQQLQMQAAQAEWCLAGSLRYRALSILHNHLFCLLVAKQGGPKLHLPNVTGSFFNWLSSTFNFCRDPNSPSEGGSAVSLLLSTDNCFRLVSRPISGGIYCRLLLETSNK